MNVCTLSYNGTQTRKCDIVHGPKEPLFEDCVCNQSIMWYSPDRNGKNISLIQYRSSKMNLFNEIVITKDVYVKILT